MLTANDYLVDWRSHSGNRAMGGCLTHACERGSVRALCEVDTGGDGCGETVAETGG